MMNAKKIGYLAVGALLAATLLGSVVLVWAFMNLPKLDGMQDYRPPLGSTVLARDGRTIGEFFDTERRYLVSIDEVPEHTISAFVAAEDDNFFHHSGVDLLGVLRAAIANLRAGGVVQGGSTITMQLAKGLLLSSERSFGRKLREIPLAYKIEKNFSKRQILYLYLNHVYFGQRAYGIEAAARVYFKKHVKELTIAESALIAGLVKAPTSYAPTRGPVRAKERQLYVLRRMHELSLINDAQYQQALAEEIKVYPEEDPNNTVAPYYMEHVRQLMMAKYGADTVYRGGLTIETAADYDLSQAATKAVRANLEDLDKRQGYRGPVGHVDTEASVAETLKEIKGEVLAKKFGYYVLPTKLPEHFSRAQYVDFTLGRLKQQDPSLNDERKLLLPWEKYRAVVTKIDGDGKAADVMIGFIPARLPVTHMRWAKRIKPPELANWATINKVSESIHTGDVVLVKPNLPMPEGSEPLTVSLEQEPLAQSALLSMEASTGYVVAMVGGYDFNHSEYNRALQGERQPGSSFKPMLYSAAIDKGYTPSSIIVDSPLVFENQGGEGSNLKWIPENNSEKFYGDTTLRTAIINSRNVPAVKLLQEMGLGYFTKYLRQLGIGGDFNADLSLALGSKAISLLDLTKFYALFPRLGLRIEPVFVLKVSDRDGKVLEEYSFKEFQKEMSARWLDWKNKQNAGKPAPTTAAAAPTATPDPATAEANKPTPPNPADIKDPPTFDDPLRALDERTAFVMGHLLQEVVQYGTGTGAKVLKRNVGGKTGTTNDFVDAWFMGFSPELVTGVWTGFDNPRTLGRGEVGGRASLPAWTDYMAAALERYKVDQYPVPNGIVFVRIDPKTGNLAGPGNSNGVREAFVEGTEPSVERQNQQTPDSSDFFREDL